MVTGCPGAARLCRCPCPVACVRACAAGAGRGRLMSLSLMAAVCLREELGQIVIPDGDPEGVVPERPLCARRFLNT